MTDIKVFCLAASGNLEEVSLSKHKGVSEMNIHPHTFMNIERGITDARTSNSLKVIADRVMSEGIDADIVMVGVGDPMSCREGEVIPQETHVVPAGQRDLSFKVR